VGLRQLAGDVTGGGRSRRRAALLLAGVTLASVGGSYTVAGAATSYHGSDYSTDYDGRMKLRTCDQESDSNIVKGGWSYTSNGGEDDSVTDGDGANGVCASAPATAGIEKHHTCEKNLFSWDCDNWQAT